MEEALKSEIEKKARRALRRLRIKRAIALRHHQKYRKRTGRRGIAPTLAEPRAWNVHPHFHPVYCIKHSRFLARTIWRKIQAGTYTPVPAIRVEIPKPNGDTRPIMMFTIPDAAVANLFNRRMTQRNLKNFSASSFGYRPDKNVFDAILYLRSAIKGEKIFVLQYDFKKYFDMIPHAYLRQLLEHKRHFLLPQVERGLVRAYTRHRFASFDEYSVRNFSERKIGVPQGSSLSQFLANAAGHELDRLLEYRSGQFARYADDVVGICYSYEDALQIAEAFEEHCRRSRLVINWDKSPGIKILGKKVDDQEMESITSFDFLGHKLTRDDILLTDKAIQRIKSRINHIMHVHLLFYPRDRRAFNRRRVGPRFYDWDLVTCLNEIRRYIYGGLQEDDLANLIRRNVRLPKVKGLMSFYVLLSSSSQLRELDGWLASELRRAHVLRRSVLRRRFRQRIRSLRSPEIIVGDWYRHPTIDQETRLPSFIRAWRAARKHYLRFGLGDVDPPRYYGY